MEYDYKWLPGTLVPPELIRQLAALYSDHYGKWSPYAPRNPGRPVRVSPEMLGKLLQPNESRLAYAVLNGEVVGYAIAIQAKIPRYGFIS